MKLVKAKRYFVKQGARLGRKLAAHARTKILKSVLVKKAKKVGQMEAHLALRLAVKYLHFQLKIRPRARLALLLVMGLSATFGILNAAMPYVKQKEAEVKINGQRVIVAADEPAKNEVEVEIAQAISSKRSPFEIKKPVEGIITQGYTWYHRALDIATDLGTPINPLGAGVVEFTGRLSDGKGNVVIVDHGNNLKSLYAHMGRIDVGVGNGVTSQDKLGTVGLTGRTSGPHVHVEIYDNGVMVDPASLLPE